MERSIEERVVAAIVEQLGSGTEITRQTVIKDLVAESLDVVELAMELEEEFCEDEVEVKIPDDFLTGPARVGDIVSFISDAVASQKKS